MIASNDGMSRPNQDEVHSRSGNPKVFGHLERGELPELVEDGRTLGGRRAHVQVQQEEHDKTEGTRVAAVVPKTGCSVRGNGKGRRNKKMTCGVLSTMIRRETERLSWTMGNTRR